LWKKRFGEVEKLRRKAEADAKRLKTQLDTAETGNGPSVGYRLLLERERDEAVKRYEKARMTTVRDFKTMEAFQRAKDRLENEVSRFEWRGGGGDDCRLRGIVEVERKIRKSHEDSEKRLQKSYDLLLERVVSGRPISEREEFAVAPIVASLMTYVDDPEEAIASRL
jgi:hypothetical protein